MLGAALLGLGMNLRETIGFYAPWLVVGSVRLRLETPASPRSSDRAFVSSVSCLRRRLVCLLVHHCGPLSRDLVWLARIDATGNGAASGHAAKPQALSHLLLCECPSVFLTFAFAIRNEWRERRLSPLLLLGLTGLLADLLLFLNYSTAVNWRYFLTGLPALAPLSANFLIRSLSRRFGSVRIAFVTSVWRCWPSPLCLVC